MYRMIKKNLFSMTVYIMNEIKKNLIARVLNSYSSYPLVYNGIITLCQSFTSQSIHIHTYIFFDHR